MRCASSQGSVTFWATECLTPHKYAFAVNYRQSSRVSWTAIQEIRLVVTRLYPDKDSDSVPYARVWHSCFTREGKHTLSCHLGISRLPFPICFTRIICCLTNFSMQDNLTSIVHGVPLLPMATSLYLCLPFNTLRCLIAPCRKGTLSSIPRIAYGDWTRVTALKGQCLEPLDQRDLQLITSWCY